MLITPRSPCQRCGSTEAIVHMVSHQATVRCARCNAFLYNAPRVELGHAKRSVHTLRKHITPTQQARILNRDHGRCVLCGRKNDLTIGHLLSLEDGLTQGIERTVLNHDLNLAAMCESCNLGLLHSDKSVHARTYLSLLGGLLKSEHDRSVDS